MATTKLMTAEELEKMPDDGQQYELMRGELICMAPASRRPSRVGITIAATLWNFVRPGRLGEVYGADGGFILARGPDIVLAPDASFARADRLQDVDEDHFIPLAPDLAVEVLSPSDRPGYIREKIRECMLAGVRLLWLVDPRRRIVTVHTPDEAPRVLSIEDELDGGDVLPGFRLPLEQLFS